MVDVLETQLSFDVRFTENRVCYIFPDLDTCLVGDLKQGRMRRVKQARIISFHESEVNKIFLFLFLENFQFSGYQMHGTKEL